MKLFFRFTFIVLFLSNEVQAQTLSANFDMAKFYYSDSLVLVEYYLSVDAGAVNFKKNNNNRYQATVSSNLILINKLTNDSIMDVFNLKSPEIDSFATFTEFNIQRRLFVDTGKYTMLLKLDDINTPDTALFTQATLDITFPQNRISCSDIQFLTSYKKTEENTLYTKNGYLLSTNISTFYPETVDKLKFYFELYHADVSFDKEEDYIISLGIENAYNYKKVGEIGKFMKMKANDFVAQLGELNISTLASGNYNFIVEVKNKENRLILVKKKYFERSNPKQDTPDKIDMDETFVASISLEEIKKYVAGFRVLSNDNEESSIGIVEKTGDSTMARNFVYSFWHSRFPNNPKYYWEQYKQRYDYADEHLSPKTMRGFTTERGRIYIKYGPPNYIEDERNDPERNNANRSIGETGIPYEIWYYYAIEHTNQTNRMFVFVNPAKVGDNYVLVHSDVRGEIFIDDWLANRNWKQYLYNFGGAGARSGGSSAGTIDYGIK